MFIYSLSGLKLTESGAPEAVEVEDNETTARTAVYQTFGRMFLPPDDECWELAQEERWAKELDHAGTLLSFEFDPGHQPVQDGSRAVLEAEYDRLFDGAILAGAWLGDASGTHDEVVRFYEYFGLKTGEGARPVDHVVTECDFMQYLTYKEAAAPSDRMRGSYRRAQLDFFGRHLSVWLPRLAAHVTASDPAPFYGWATTALTAFVASDHAYVTSLLGP
jgi:DMSO reductase family type II enzyme chaperone